MHARNKYLPPVALTLRRGCVDHDPAAGLWLLRGTQWKGATDLSGAKLAAGKQREDPWVVVEPVVRAIGVLERLQDGPLLFPATLLLAGDRGSGRGRQWTRRDRARASQLVAQDLDRLVAWVNDYCAATGRGDQQIPPDPASPHLAPSRFRRTLAWHIVRRPRGLIAGAIQYGHLKVQITLGYAGTYASGFPDEHAFEDWLWRLEQLADAQQRLAAGEHVSGPAAPAYRERVHQANQRFAGHTLTSARQARALLANPALRIFPAKGMTCVYDPVKAMCQRDTPADVRRTPDLSNCHPACQNIARTDRDVDRLRQQATELAALVDDPLSPQPRHQRERHELQRLQMAIDEHDHTRPTTQPPW